MWHQPVSSVFVTLTSGSKVKVVFETAFLWFFLRLPTDFAKNTRRGINQVIIRFHDIDLGVKGQGESHTKCVLRPHVSDFSSFPTDFAQNRTQGNWHHPRSHTFSWHWPRGHRWGWRQNIFFETVCPRCLRFPTDFAQNRTQHVASSNVSSVFVILTSGSKDKVKVTKVLFGIACLIFSSLSDRFGSKSHTRRGITQGLIHFRDIDLGVKGEGHKKSFLWLRVSDFFFD